MQKKLVHSVNLMSLLMRTRNHPSLRERFSGMLLLPVVKMSSKPSKWLFDIVGGIIFFLSLDLFSIMFKNIFLALFFGGRSPRRPPYGLDAATTRLFRIALPGRISVTGKYTCT